MAHGRVRSSTKKNGKGSSAILGVLGLRSYSLSAVDSGVGRSRLSLPRATRLRPAWDSPLPCARGVFPPPWTWVVSLPSPSPPSPPLCVPPAAALLSLIGVGGLSVPPQVARGPFTSEGASVERATKRGGQAHLNPSELTVCESASPDGQGMDVLADDGWSALGVPASST